MRTLRKIASSIRKYRIQKHTVFFICILLVGIGLRFYNTPDRFGFDRDPTRDALIVLYGIHHLVFPLIGPSSGLAPFNFGPWYYYELILFHLLIPLKFAAFYFVPLNSLLIIPLMYFIGREVKNTTVGLVAAAFAAISPGQMDLTNALSNPSLVSPHAAFSVLFFLYYVKNKRSFTKTILWGLIMGIGINHHFQMLPLLLLPVIAFLISFRTSLKHVLFFLAGLFASFIPLIIFNYQTNWHTVKGFLQMLHGGGGYFPNSWRIYLGQFWPGFSSYLTGLPGLISILLLIILVGIHLYMYTRKELAKSYLLLIASFLIIFIALRYYNGPREYYYVAFLHPFIFIFTGIALWRVWNAVLGKILIMFVALAAIIIILPIDIHKAHTREDNIYSRESAEKLMGGYSGPYQIYSCGNSRIELAQGVAFYLETSQRLSDSGKRVALKDASGKCDLPKSQSVQGTKFVDVSKMPKDVLRESGWKTISSKTVYKETLEWWKK